jgi:hypothetical protein
MCVYTCELTWDDCLSVFNIGVSSIMSARLLAVLCKLSSSIGLLGEYEVILFY